MVDHEGAEVFHDADEEEWDVDATEVLSSRLSESYMEDETVVCENCGHRVKVEYKVQMFDSGPSDVNFLDAACLERPLLAKNEMIIQSMKKFDATSTLFRNRIAKLQSELELKDIRLREMALQLKTAEMGMDKMAYLVRTLQYQVNALSGCQGTNGSTDPTEFTIPRPDSEIFQNMSFKIALLQVLQPVLLKLKRLKGENIALKNIVSDKIAFLKHAVRLDGEVLMQLIKQLKSNIPETAVIPPTPDTPKAARKQKKTSISSTSTGAADTCDRPHLAEATLATFQTLLDKISVSMSRFSSSAGIAFDMPKVALPKDSAKQIPTIQATLSLLQNRLDEAWVQLEDKAEAEQQEAKLQELKRMEVQQEEIHRQVVKCCKLLVKSKMDPAALQEVPEVFAEFESFMETSTRESKSPSASPMRPVMASKACQCSLPPGTKGAVSQSGKSPGNQSLNANATMLLPFGSNPMIMVNQSFGGNASSMADQSISGNLLYDSNSGSQALLGYSNHSSSNFGLPGQPNGSSQMHSGIQRRSSSMQTLSKNSRRTSSMQGTQALSSSSMTSLAPNQENPLLQTIRSIEELLETTQQGTTHHRELQKLLEEAKKLLAEEGPRRVTSYKPYVPEDKKAVDRFHQWLLKQKFRLAKQQNLLENVFRVLRGYFFAVAPASLLPNESDQSSASDSLFKLQNPPHGPMLKVSNLTLPVDVVDVSVRFVPDSPQSPPKVVSPINPPSSRKAVTQMTDLPLRISPTHMHAKLSKVKTLPQSPMTPPANVNFEESPPPTKPQDDSSAVWNTMKRKWIAQIDMNRQCTIVGSHIIDDSNEMPSNAGRNFGSSSKTAAQKSPSIAKLKPILLLPSAP